MVRVNIYIFITKKKVLFILLFASSSGLTGWQTHSFSTLMGRDANGKRTFLYAVAAAIE